MKRYWLVVATILGFSLALFLLVEALGVPLLTDLSPWLKRGGLLAALVGVGLLIVDVVLPVTSSLVMVAHGALFGVTVGTFLSLLGSTGEALVGFALGRRGGPLLARLVPTSERARADRLLARWGTLAIIVTRPVPLLAETTAMMAGASPLAIAASFQNGALVFGLVLLVALFWLAGRWLEPRLVKRTGSGRT